MKTLIFTLPVEDPHTEKTAHHRIAELGVIHQAVLFRGLDHESPERIIVVKIFQLVVLPTVEPSLWSPSLLTSTHLAMQHTIPDLQLGQISIKNDVDSEYLEQPQVWSPNVDRAVWVLAIVEPCDLADAMVRNEHVS